MAVLYSLFLFRTSFFVVPICQVTASQDVTHEDQEDSVSVDATGPQTETSTQVRVDLISTLSPSLRGEFESLSELN